MVYVVVGVSFEQGHMKGADGMMAKRKSRRVIERW
jgi:hypothetical protein